MPLPQLDTRNLLPGLIAGTNLAERKKDMQYLDRRNKLLDAAAAREPEEWEHTRKKMKAESEDIEYKRGERTRDEEFRARIGKAIGDPQKLQGLAEEFPTRTLPYLKAHIENARAERKESTEFFLKGIDAAMKAPTKRQRENILQGLGINMEMSGGSIKMDLPNGYTVEGPSDMVGNAIEQFTVNSNLLLNDENAKEVFRFMAKNGVSFTKTKGDEEKLYETEAGLLPSRKAIGKKPYQKPDEKLYETEAGWQTREKAIGVKKGETGATDLRKATMKRNIRKDVAEAFGKTDLVGMDDDMTDKVNEASVIAEYLLDTNGIDNYNEAIMDAYQSVANKYGLLGGLPAEADEPSIPVLDSGNIDETVKAVKTMIEGGWELSQIKPKLEGAGWKPKHIEEIFGKVMGKTKPQKILQKQPTEKKIDFTAKDVEGRIVDFKAIAGNEPYREDGKVKIIGTYKGKKQILTLDVK